MPSTFIASPENDNKRIAKRPFSHIEDEVLVKKCFKASSMSLVDLIHEALDTSESGLLSLAEIYDFITAKYSSDQFFIPSSWRNSIRTNLSMQSCFHKIDRPAGKPGKGYLWASDKSLEKIHISVSHRMPPIVKDESCERGPQVHAWSGDIWVPDIKEETFAMEIPLNLSTECMTDITSQLPSLEGFPPLIRMRLVEKNMQALSMFRSVALGRSLSIAPRPLSCAFKPFSTTSFFKSSNADLVHRLSKELDYEKENRPEVPDLIKEFKAKSGWIINEEQGKKEVIMTKTMGPETVKVFINTDAVADMHSEEEEGYLPIVAIFSKDNQKGALEIQLALQESSFEIDSVAFYDVATAVKLGPQGEFERAEAYAGPGFEQLQPELRDDFAAYIKERGFDEALAEFLPALLEVKEQDEYVRWLQRVSEFVKE